VNGPRGGRLRPNSFSDDIGYRPNDVFLRGYGVLSGVNDLSRARPRNRRIVLREFTGTRSASHAFHDQVRHIHRVPDHDHDDCLARPHGRVRWSSSPRFDLTKYNDQQLLWRTRGGARSGGASATPSGAHGSGLRSSRYVCVCQRRVVVPRRRSSVPRSTAIIFGTSRRSGRPGVTPLARSATG
jgi:hypothetical protein